MCGIAGFVQKQATGEFDSVLRRMTDRMQKRGPDGSGYWISPPLGGEGWKAALGHRRLSIIDLEGGAQPLGNENGRIQVTFNGEIFNFLALRPELENRGHRFKTRSDTEVIVHHLEEFGDEGVKDFNGMFAFALWDQDRGRLLLARDRAGVKPLYYARLPDGGIAFASELTALIQHPSVSKRLSQDALAGYFFSDYVQAPQSMIEGVYKLEPGHTLVWEKGKLFDPKPFWNVQEVLSKSAGEEKSVSELSARLEQLLEASVDRQLISDVPVGVFLSGGIDSSIVAALARRKAGASIRTFSMAFKDKDFDESSYARLVAKHLGTDHQEEFLTEANLIESLDAALNVLDEPNSDPSILPTFCLSRLTVRSVKVALGGDGGDELFAGYPTYKAFNYSRYYKLLPEVLRKRVIDEVVTRLPVNLTYQSFEWKAKRFALRWDNNPFRRHLRWMSNTDLPELGEILNSPGGRSQREPQVLRLADQLGESSSDCLNSLLALDFQTYLPGSVLGKVDRTSMGNSLEVRPPFLDNDVMNWAFSLPSEMKLRGGFSKYILKEMARSFLPEEVVNRRKKGFAIPLGRWLRGPLEPRITSVLRDSPLWLGSALNRATFERWAQEHAEQKADRSKPLWSLIVLDHWARREGIDVTD